MRQVCSERNDWYSWYRTSMLSSENLLNSNICACLCLCVRSINGHRDPFFFLPQLRRVQRRSTLLKNCRVAFLRQREELLKKAFLYRPAVTQCCMGMWVISNCRLLGVSQQLLSLLINLLLIIFWHASAVALGTSLLVYWQVHDFDPDWNVSTTMRWITTKLFWSFIDFASSTTISFTYVLLS